MLCPASDSAANKAGHRRIIIPMGRRFAFNKTVEEYRRLAKECRETSCASKATASGLSQSMDRQGSGRSDMCDR